MKSHAILMVVALVVQAFLAQAASAAEELVVPPHGISAPEILGPPEAVSPRTNEFDVPCEEFGSPLTLMQWSYGDGADGDVLYRPLESDRPYFTKSASVVGRGQWQLETGATYGRDARQRLNLTSFPEALLRFGALAEWLEFRVGWNWVDDGYSNWRRAYDATFPYVGVKIALAPQDEMLPETAILFDADMPTKDFIPSLATDAFQPGLSFLYHWDFENGYEMGGATEFRRIADKYSPSLLFAQSWILERSFTDSLTGFVEWFMIAPDAPRSHIQHSIDTGLLYTLTDNVQLDAIAGFGLNNAAFDYFVGSGVSVRW